MNPHGELATEAAHTEKPRRGRKSILIITGVVLLAVMLLSITFGSVRISLANLFATLFGDGSQEERIIIWSIRIPRILMALIVGASLSIAGALLQAVMHNPLADPGLTGVLSGASVMVLFIMLVMPEMSGWIPLSAVVGGSVAATMVYVLAWHKRFGMTPMRIILAGVAVNAVFGGITGYLSLMYSDKLPSALAWMNGSLSGNDMNDVLGILPFAVAGWIMAFFCIRQANMLRLGDDTAHQLGQNVMKVRLWLSFVAVYLASISVVKVGIVGFIGLIVPHMARLLIGSNYKFSLPMTILLGPVVLIIADTIGRTVFSPIEIPAGIIMSLVGGPYFLYLMRKGRV